MNCFRFSQSHRLFTCDQNDVKPLNARLIACDVCRFTYSLLLHHSQLVYLLSNASKLENRRNWIDWWIIIKQLFMRCGSSSSSSMPFAHFSIYWSDCRLHVDFRVSQRFNHVAKKFKFIPFGTTRAQTYFHDSCRCVASARVNYLVLIPKRHHRSNFAFAVSLASFDGMWSERELRAYKSETYWSRR